MKRDGSSSAPQAVSATDPATNPLLGEWRGPYGGVPPFDHVELEHFRPALQIAMDECIAEVERVAADPAPPTFENTLAAMERTGRTLSRVAAVYNIWSSTLSSPEFRTVEREMAPRLAALRDRIVQNKQLFQRVEAVYDASEDADLTSEQRRLAWHYHTNFVRAGARLDDGAKARLAEIKQELAGLYTEFSQNVLVDESDRYLVLDSKEDLAGLPEGVQDAAATAAEEKGLVGRWVIANTRSSVEPFLTFAKQRGRREEAWRMWVSRGEEGERNNYPIVTRILALRAERAKLLGYPSHAHWRLENTMAATPARAMELLEAVWEPAVARVREEVADMERIVAAEGGNHSIEPWDYRYYAEKVRAARYDLDPDEVAQYLHLDRLRDAMFWVAGELLGYDFEAVDVPVYHPTVEVWEVRSRPDGEHVGLFYFDPYARAGKKSGAWMNAYRRQEAFDGVVPPIISNNSNFVPGRPGDPVLISWTDATTLFHEFGHALHGLASQVRYPSLAGTSVARDFVEFPSQLLEHWLTTPEVLQRFALHHRSGEPIPPRLVERIERSATFNQGFSTTEYLASAIVDMKLHLEADGEVEPRSFEEETLGAIGLPKEIVMRHRTPHFAHIFSGDSYSAGYYSYLWADVLTADAAEAFTEAGGFYDREIAARLRDHVLSTGNSMDPAEAYRDFRGRDPEIGALMRKRGFPAV
jgi:peptidyl-dipeptidase Dcp